MQQNIRAAILKRRQLRSVGETKVRIFSVWTEKLVNYITIIVYTNFTRRQAHSNKAWIITINLKIDNGWESSFFARYRQNPVIKSLQK